MQNSLQRSIGGRALPFTARPKNLEYPPNFDSNPKIFAFLTICRVCRLFCHFPNANPIDFRWVFAGAKAAYRRGPARSASDAELSSSLLRPDAAAKDQT